MEIVLSYGHAAPSDPATFFLKFILLAICVITHLGGSRSDRRNHYGILVQLHRRE
ncbi:hypothetical protein RUM4293_02939 [Ruegeria atlantica]|uniref:Uncharacterized protein n=1 Tax=Ruegeria atlantica TaxID=81569 RepID=A0A0P1E771_9RHOB|nr:hypothetical protein RUM4293_02939 [Ruegeria atlantica]